MWESLIPIVLALAGGGFGIWQFRLQRREEASAELRRRKQDLYREYLKFHTAFLLECYRSSSDKVRRDARNELSERSYALLVIAPKAVADRLVELELRLLDFTGRIRGHYEKRRPASADPDGVKSSERKYNDALKALVNEMRADTLSDLAGHIDVVEWNVAGKLIAGRDHG